MHKTKGFHLINAVWGDDYTELFMNVSLPTQLSKGNLQAFSNDKNSRYIIYTSCRDAQNIVKHPIYSILSDIIKTEIKVFDFSVDFLKNNKHQAMTYCHQHAVVKANKNDCSMIFLSPDTIWSDGSFKKIIELEQLGKRAIMLGACRCTKESLVPAFLNLFKPDKNPIVSVSSRQLVQIFLEHLHPTTQALFWNSIGCKSAWPSIIIWPVGDEGVLIRQFHVHPLMVNPSKKDVLPIPTVDGQYISLACPDKENIYVIEDSDDIYACEISVSSMYPEHIRPNGITDVTAVAEWMSYITDPFHRHCFKNFSLKHHVRELSPLWSKAQKESDEVVGQIETLFQENYQRVSAWG